MRKPKDRTVHYDIRHSEEFGWHVIRRGAKAPTMANRGFTTQAEAEQRGQEIASRKRLKVELHSPQPEDWEEEQWQEEQEAQAEPAPAPKPAKKKPTKKPGGKKSGAKRTQG